jgi:hypothetical protein
MAQQRKITPLASPSLSIGPKSRSASGVKSFNLSAPFEML